MEANRRVVSTLPGLPASALATDDEESVGAKVGTSALAESLLCHHSQPLASPSKNIISSKANANMNGTEKHQE